MTAPRLQVVRDELPDSETLAIGQSQGATDILHEDKSRYPRFTRLRGLHGLAGSMAPGEVWMAGARVGNGKSLFAQNVMDDFIGQQLPTLYVGTEQDPEVLRIKHACIRAGVSARLMLKPDEHEIHSTAYEGARDAVQRELQWLRQEAHHLALFANCEYVNQTELRRWIVGGVEKYDIRCVIVDHIDQVAHGSGQNSVHELTATLQMIHGLMREHEMAALILSQLKRTIDPIRRYTPPEEQDFAGASGKERIASVMFGLWRPLRTDLGIKELRVLLADVKHGFKAEDRVYQPATMGVRLLKDRLGDVPGKQIMLYVGKGGRLDDDDAATHGIR